jgi:hypothetical protein
MAENDLKCKRCGNSWIRKFDKDPKVCPSCKSIYWNKPMSNYWKTVREMNKRKKERKQN